MKKNKTSKKVLLEIVGNPDDKIFNDLIIERGNLILSQAPMGKLMEITAKIGKLVLEDMTEETIEYNLESLKTLDSVIDQNRKVFNEHFEKGESVFIIWFGALIGEIIVREFNMEWKPLSKEEDPTNYLLGQVRIGEGLLASPISMIYEALKNEDNKIINFVTEIGLKYSTKIP